MSIDLSQFHDAFFEEALEGLDQAEESLLHLEKQGLVGENIDAAFRAIHSIKGSSGTLGFDQITEFSHSLEAVLEIYRSLSNSDRLRVQDEHMSLILSGLDLLRAMVSNAQQKQGDIPSGRVNALGLKLRQLQKELDAPSHVIDPRDSHIQELGSGSREFIIKFRPFPGMLECGNDPLRYLDALAAQGTLVTSALWDEQAALAWQLQGITEDSRACFLHWSCTLMTDLTAIQLGSMFEWVEGLCDLDIEELSLVTNLLDDPMEENQEKALPNNLDAALELPETAFSSKGSSEPNDRRKEHRAIQVPTAKIDSLLGHLADLATFQSELDGKVIDKDIRDLFNRLGRQTRQLQDAILAIRMSPISTLFKRFERVIRDAELELGKRVNVVIEGETSELDSSIIERLIDPVTHLIRNALDHGIELPCERARLGKPAVATLSLRAEQRGSNFVLSIGEDGSGFDIQAIRAKAIQKGLVSAQTERSDAQWAEMIFAPGFSTAAKINQWSGRGVGLDAVSQAINALNGQLVVTSTPGQGTIFSIELPLTLALTDALIVEAKGEQYALPISAISECIQLVPSSFRALSNGQQLYAVGQRLIPFMSLATLMQTKVSASMQAEHLSSSPSCSLGVVLKNSEEACLLGVTRIIGERQCVIKSIEKNLGSAKFCQSATILGQGRVTFVLDAGALCAAIGSLQLTSA